jgi:hypothetical protein
MIATLFAVATIGLLQLITGQNVSLADSWNVRSVAFNDDGFDDVFTLALARGVVSTHCSTIWTSLQRPGGATPIEWMDCADQALKFRIPFESFVSTHDFVVHLLTTEYSK